MTATLNHTDERTTTDREAAQETKNVFFVSLDEFNHNQLRLMRNANRFSFHPLLEYEEIPREVGEVADIDDLLDEARRRLDAFPGSIDGISTFWDFPAAEMAPILCHERGLSGPTLQAVLRSQHKYWARLEQKAAVPECVPGFCPVNVYDDASLAAIDLAYPFWIKPVRAYSSHLGFRIRNRDDLKNAVEEIREKIPRLGDPFNAILRHAGELPPEVEGVDGRWCVAERIISGRQCTLEGWVHNGETHVFGAIDSRRMPNGSSFSRYQYPSTLPNQVQQRMIDITRRLMEHIGYDDAAFNIELFWQRDTNRIHLLEVNTPGLAVTHRPLHQGQRQPEPPGQRGSSPWAKGPPCRIATEVSSDARASSSSAATRTEWSPDRRPRPSSRSCRTGSPPRRSSSRRPRARASPRWSTRTATPTSSR
ncbi:MAG: ATP-grasp domain-containing protein [Acidimicrobiia bacterium]|nr:ATP-grasp domain-containing protein [Acidimicrobiia bacterium]